MAFMRDSNKTSGLLKFSQSNMSWQDYLAYMDRSGALSSNLEKDMSGHYSLRAGYTPEWTLKDFK